MTKQSSHTHQRPHATYVIGLCDILHDLFSEDFGVSIRVSAANTSRMVLCEGEVLRCTIHRAGGRVHQVPYVHRPHSLKQEL